MDYTYVSESVLSKMKSEEQNQESSPSKTCGFFSLGFFGRGKSKGHLFPMYEYSRTCFAVKKHGCVSVDYKD